LFQIASNQPLTQGFRQACVESQWRDGF